MTRPRPRWERSLAALRSSGIGLILLAVGAMWFIEVLDTFVLGDRLQRNGIQPRSLDGLDGVLWAPFLHSNFGHVFSNTVPLLVMGGLVSVRGFRYWGRATVSIALVGGTATWLLAGAGNHIGASGIVFGYFGVLLGAAWFERKAAALGAALLAVFLYSGIVAGLVPQPGLSWEGHLFGFLAGLLSAKLMAEPRQGRGPDRPDEMEPWELEGPWA